MFVYYVEPAVAVRSTLADARGSIQFGYDTDGSGSEKQDRETEKPPTPLRRLSQQHSVDNNGVSLRNIIHSKDLPDAESQFQNMVTVEDVVAASTVTPVRKTSFATLPNTTTWQQQSANYQHINNNSKLFEMEVKQYRTITAYYHCLFQLMMIVPM